MRIAYQKLMFELAGLLGGDPKSITQPLKEIFEFEKKIAQVGFVILRDSAVFSDCDCIEGEDS